ncbi:MAG: serine hydrolase [Planctomycetes bacterium]|nr:serine hydrolase [Planctomycetota bacterium]
MRAFAPRVLRGVAFLALALAAGCAARPLRDVEAILARAPGTWGVWFRDLGTGETLELRADRSFHAASTMKVLVLLKVFRDVEEGRFSLDDEVPVTDVFPSAVEGELRTEAEAEEVREAIGRTLSVRSLAHWMVAASDNLATNLLIQKAGGPAAVAAEARRQGLARTTVARYIMDLKAFEAGLSSTAVPREIGRLLERLWRGEVVSPAASRAMLEVLSGAGPEWLALELPPGARAAHKTGSIERTRHDVGVVTAPSGRAFVLCVYGADLRDEAAGERAIAQLGRHFCERVEAR